MLEQPFEKTVTCSCSSFSCLFIHQYQSSIIFTWTFSREPYKCFHGIGWHKLEPIETKFFLIGIEVQKIVRFRAMNSANTCNITTDADERCFWWLLSLKSRTFLWHVMFLSPGFSTVDIGDPSTYRVPSSFLTRQIKGQMGWCKRPHFPLPPVHHLRHYLVSHLCGLFQEGQADE